MNLPPLNPFAAAVQRAMRNTPDDGHREPTEYEKSILVGLSTKLPRVYEGYAADRFVTQPNGDVVCIPDPRIAQTDRRRARNRVARRSRRINRVRG